MSFRRTFAAAAAVIIVTGSTARAAEDHSQHAGHSGHGGHQMTDEQIEILKSKIELYRPYSNEEINAAMARMYDANDYLSEPALMRDVGVLALGHGYKAEGDVLFKQGYAAVAAEYPTAVGLGMTMMDSNDIQVAVSRLEAAGAKTIVVLPTEIGDNTSLIRQWEYAFGLRDTSSYLDVARIRTGARVIIAKTPTTSPVVTDILSAYVKEASAKAAEEVVVLISHGPEDAADNERELANLARHAAGIQAATGVAEVHYGTLQDDAPPTIRQKNVDRLRGWIASATGAGRRVIVVPVVVVSRSGVSSRITRDLQGLAYTSTIKGIAESPLFDRWVRQTLAAALAASPEAAAGNTRAGMVD